MPKPTHAVAPAAPRHVGSAVLAAVVLSAGVLAAPAADATPRGKGAPAKGGGKSGGKATGKAGAKATKPDEAKPDEPAAEPTPSPSGAAPTPSPSGAGAAPTTGGAGSGAPAGPATAGAGGGGPAATPVPGEAKTPEVPEPAAADVDGLRQEYLALRDELFKSRARAAAVASQLYSTKISLKLTWTSARAYGVGKAAIRLDGATVYEDAGGAIGADDGVRFEGYLAPGRHLITFRVEATGKDDDRFASATESQIVVQAVTHKDLVVSARAHDGGDIAYEWQRHERGSYELGLDVGVKTVAHPDAGGAGPAAGKKGGK